MDKIAATIRAQYDSLIEAYKQRLQAISGVALSNQIGDEWVRTLFHHLADALETGGDTEFVQNWVANVLDGGISPETLQANLTAFEPTLIPLATTLESATTLWQIFSQIRAAIVAQTTEQLNSSAQKQTEQQLRKSEAQLAEATAIAKLYYWEFDVAAQRFTFSPEYFKALNIPITDETDFTMSVEEYAQKYIPPEEAALVGQRVEAALTSSEAEYSSEVEASNLTADGRVIPVMVRFRLVRDEEGSPIKLVGANQDITERKRVEQELRENEARLADATNIAKLYYWEIDFATREIIVSLEYYKFLGIEDDGIYRMPVDKYAKTYVHPDYAPLVGQVIRDGLTSSAKEPYRELESRLITTDGREVPILVRLRVIRDEQGNPIKALGANQDITEQKRVEQQLRDATELQRTIVDNAAYGIISTTPEGVLMSLNPAAERMLGYRAAELVSKETLAIWHDPAEVAARAKEFSAELGETIEPVEVLTVKARRNLPNQYEWTYIRKDGSRFPVSLSITAIRDEAGEITGFIGFAQDITKQKQAEADRTEMEEMLRLTRISVDQSIDSIFWVGPDARLLFVNDGTCRNLGYSHEELTSMAVYDFDPNFPAQIWPKHWQELKKQGTMVFETEHQAKDGRLIPVEVRLYYLEYKGQEYNFVIARDITEQKAAEETLRRSEAELSQALKIAKLAYWEYDVGKDLFTFNDQFYALFHTTAEEHGGYQLSSAYYAQHFVHPDDLPVVGSEIERALNSTDRYYNRLLDHRILYADGSVGYISASVNIERDEQSNILRYYGANQDITKQKVAEAELQKRASELAAVSEISTQIGQISDPVEMLQQVADLTKERFELYHAHIYLLDEAGEMLKLVAGAGETGRTMVAQGWSISFEHESSLVAVTARKQTGTIANDVQANPDFLSNPLLPETRSEMAVPLLVGEKLLGVLDVQGDVVDRFTEQDIQIETTLASQVAIALQNARQYQQTQEALEELRRSEEVLRENEERLSQATAAAKLYEWELDFATQIFTFSPEYYKLLNIPITDETDFKMSVEEYAEKYVKNPEVVGREVERVLASRESDYSQEIEDHNVTTDGRLIPIMVRFRLIRDKDGNPIRTVGANQDITEQKRIQEILAKQADDLQKVAEISTRIATTHNEAQLLQEVVDLTKDRIGLYHAHLYLLDEGSETLILTAGAGEIGQAMVAEGRMIPFNHPRSIVALTARTGEGTIVNNVRENPDFLPHPLLPKTRSEMAVPMIVGDRLLGVFDIQADVVDRFTEEDRQILTTLAAQVAVALENARLLAQVERALADVKIVQQQYIQQAWGKAGQTQKRTYRYERSGLAPLADEMRHKAKELARQKKEPVLVTLDPDMKGAGQQSVVAPISLSGATIGSLQLHLAEGQNESQALDEDDLALLEVILEQVAQTAENLRLFEETRERAGREQTIREITEKMRAATNLNQLVKATATELGERLSAGHIFIELGIQKETPVADTDVTVNGQQT
ncbi:MAG: PAS domain S-box protein [Anaerolineae bacterium]|nr:PAS domain S-box protein [Anaerolineae bacterium]